MGGGASLGNGAMPRWTGEPEVPREQLEADMWKLALLVRCHDRAQGVRLLRHESQRKLLDLRLYELLLLCLRSTLLDERALAELPPDGRSAASCAPDRADPYGSLDFGGLSGGHGGDWGGGGNGNGDGDAEGYDQGYDQGRGALHPELHALYPELDEFGRVPDTVGTGCAGGADRIAHSLDLHCGADTGGVGAGHRTGDHVGADLANAPLPQDVSSLDHVLG